MRRFLAESVEASPRVVIRVLGLGGSSSHAALSVRPDQEPLVGPWESCGTADGPRLASMIRSWGSRADVLAEPGRADELRSALELFSGFGQGIQSGEWRMTRPSANQVWLEADLILTSPDSSR